MEAVAERDSVLIVHWETGRSLATFTRALDPNVLEVGTAIGYSALHLAQPLSAGRVTTLEIDAELARQARDFWSRAGVAERSELVEGPEGRRTMRGLRSRKTPYLAERLEQLDPEERVVLAQASELLERLLEDGGE